LTMLNRVPQALQHLFLEVEQYLNTKRGVLGVALSDNLIRRLGELVQRMIIANPVRKDSADEALYGLNRCLRLTVHQPILVAGKALPFGVSRPALVAFGANLCSFALLLALPPLSQGRQGSDHLVTMLLGRGRLLQRGEEHALRDLGENGITRR